ncbi:MAG: hypothetical protein HY704_15730 [Gemmatimonadetes bacterium]|nr:hypothetical protein [Gemmatimonadota bacterium]
MGRLLRALGLRMLPPPWPPLPLEPPGTLAAGRIAGEYATLAVAVGPRPDASAAGIARDIRRLVSATPGRRWLLLFHDLEFRWLTFASPGVDGEVRRLELRRQAPDAAALEALAEMAARPGDGGTALALRHARALARGRITERFFGEFRAVRAGLARAWTGLAPDDDADRDELALLLLCRLLFLHFIEARGWLDGDPRFVARLLERRLAAPGRDSFFRARLQPLFFEALNAPRGRRAVGSLDLDRLPYLDGGLFARRPVERRQPDADLPDAALTALFDGFFARYRFTPVEAEADAGGASVDPEILGRVFEGLMEPRERCRSGTFYTPRAAVRALVMAALESHLTAALGGDPTAAAAGARPPQAAIRIADLLDGNLPDEATRMQIATALRGVRVLDPAAGSGALLLGCLELLMVLRRACGDEAGMVDELRAALYGVDIKAEAVLLCMLRLWLALSVAAPAGVTDAPHPLPNLDRRIRQGDALVDPLEFAMAAFEKLGEDARSARALRALETLRSRHFDATGPAREEIERSLGAAERKLALSVLESARAALCGQLDELRAVAASRDLFGAPAAGQAELGRMAELEARLAEVELRHRQCTESNELPFFSFRLHFSEVFTRGGFDIVITNPPWVRPHRWSRETGPALRQRYAVLRAPSATAGSGDDSGDAGDSGHSDCRRGSVATESSGGRGRRAAGRLAGSQSDLSLAFLERSLELLRPGGTLAILLPAKCLRALYGATARAMLLRCATLVALEDHALDQNAIFSADSFVAMLVLRKEPAPPRHLVRVRVTRRSRSPVEFRVGQTLLPSGPEPGAPWLLAPPPVAEAVRAMQAAGQPLGAHVRVHRGVFTAANDVFLLREAAGGLGGIVRAVSAAGDPGARRTADQANATEEADREGGSAVPVHVEGQVLRRVVRGSGIRAWSFEAPEHILWLHADGRRDPEPPPRLAAAYLARHRRRLESRDGARRLPPGALFRVSPAVIGPKVMWQDLADRPAAAYVFEPVRCADGVERPVIPLNTVYFVIPPDDDAGHFLAALLNSRPVATYVRAVAERAKDARFRFLAWTMEALPIPAAWAEAPESGALIALSRRAHGAGALAGPDEARQTKLVARLYGLSEAQLGALLEWDRWLAEAACAAS